jgi:hypothetical protein
VCEAVSVHFKVERKEKNKTAEICVSNNNPVFKFIEHKNEMRIIIII